jgi:hypothetical protein
MDRQEVLATAPFPSAETIDQKAPQKQTWPFTTYEIHHM